MKIIVSHPTGNANVRAVTEAFFSNNILQHFYTSIACFPRNIWDKIGINEFQKRSFDPLLQPYTKQYPWRELGRSFAKKTKWDKLVTHENGLFSVDKVYHSLDKHVATQLSYANLNNTKAVYAYEDGALETFKEAKNLGLTCIYDLPIAYWETARKLLKEEAERLPQWAVTLGGGIKDSDEKLARKTEELKLADILVGPGSFVMNSIPTWAKSKSQIVSPFGSPPSIINFNKKGSSENRPLKVLFAGGLSQRKGLGDLFKAFKLLDTNQIELVVLGSLLAPMNFYKNQLTNFSYVPTRSHSKVLELMRSCDIFCLPSIVEGRALVIQEAMSQGLPIIITPNTGGEDLVEEGKTGFLVPIRSPESIAEKLNWFVENRRLIPEMGELAREKALFYSWDNYGNTIVENLKTQLL